MLDYVKFPSPYRNTHIT